MLGFKKSPWIIHYDASSCNGCDIETLACLTPLYDVERLGVINTGNPKHADIFLVTGAVNEQSQDVIRNIYHQLPEPKVVVAVGICAASGGIFRDCYNISGGVDSVIPVDVYVPGCAARPEAIIDGVVKALGVLEEKHRDMKAMANSIDKTLYLRAEQSGRAGNPGAAEDRLPERGGNLRRRQPAGAAADAGDLETSSSARDFASGRMHVFLKAVVNGKIIGSVRGYAADGTAYLSRADRASLFPAARHRPAAARGDRKGLPAGERVSRPTPATRASATSISLAKRGYQTFKTEPFTPTITWVYLQKDHVRPMQPKFTDNASIKPSKPFPPRRCWQGSATCASKASGWSRSAPRGCPEHVELTYSFDRDSQLANLRLQLPAAEARVPSISSIYWCAFLYENEIHDLFTSRWKAWPWISRATSTRPR